MLVNLPVIHDAASLPNEYYAELDCSQENLKTIIEEVASFVSKVYTKFSRLTDYERNLIRNRSIIFSSLTTRVPSNAECEQFESVLKAKIITILSQKKEEICRIQLIMDYIPEGSLREIVESVFQEKQYTTLFPYKTHTWLSLNSNKTKLTVDMDFRMSR